ncbi:hypothetical protein DA803_01240 [[Mycoplasma] phocae]|uniref:Integrase n=2 Tax=[Mycoplasma] phocae TaxID=142651 RepID=A0A2Z5IQG5_9BACT|nr:hypothetical protein DA803_01240 [[Mycoplasma] phocae]
MPFDQKISSFKTECGTIRNYTTEELKILFVELKKINNLSYEFIFKFILFTDIRISKLNFTDWNSFQEKIIK